MKEGVDIIKGFAQNLPDKPGVYRMINSKGHIIYVGKAKALKKRVSSYTRLSGHSNRIQRMIHETVYMEFIQTHTESEALLLEANMIKKHKPPYNILLRDDQNYPYIEITDIQKGNHDFPMIKKHRGKQKKTSRYFGPFASTGAVNQTVDILQKVFLLRNCSDSVFANRTRPCLQYQIKRCTAPCVGYVHKKEYREQVKQAFAFLKGQSTTIQSELSLKMQQASKNLDFEKATLYRDRIRALSTIQAKQDINLSALGDVDIIAVYMQNEQICVQVFFFRGGRNYGNRPYFLQAEADNTLPEIIAGFITQFYDNKPVPRTLLLSHEAQEQKLIAEALSQKAEHKITLLCPRKGDKKRLVDQAIMNAKEALTMKQSQISAQKQIFAELKNLFALPAPPKRIEVYDNSHINGAQAVGAMIVAGSEGFVKKAYRKFNIKNPKAKQDDFAMMREVFTRRFSRAIKEDPLRNKGEWPDLILVDGGKGQLSSAYGVLKELNIKKVPIFGISKGPDRHAGREKFHDVSGRVFELEPGNPVLFFLQRLRDESHRFVIGTHRIRRKKENFQSSLEAVPGVGPKRKKALLLHFGSAKAVEQAAVADIIKVEGVSAHIALRIYNYFHDNL